MSFIMVMVLVGIYIVLVEGEYCIECRDTKREQRQAQKVKMDVAGWKRGHRFGASWCNAPNMSQIH
jgi:hypothetical protein